MPYERQLEALYAAFNARDIDALLAGMTDDVDWPNAWERGRLHGKHAVRDYWTRQWREIDPRVEPVAFNRHPSGGVAVEVQQIVRTRDGALVSESMVVHVYSFRGGLVSHMDIEDA
ncbi:MAG TPA: nuclear transport factor 2 family protein [Solirubrobacteraceae bacterium]|nr:nuclear transport factor 2 family protein [Solirubrobacteraceae bacterium]